MSIMDGFVTECLINFSSGTSDLVSHLQAWKAISTGQTRRTR